MRRALVAAVLAGAALLVPSGAAWAQQAPPETTTTTETTVPPPVQVAPSGTFVSPLRAVAGQPIFVRSVTPCPTNGSYRYATAYLRPQGTPSSTSEIDYTMADLRPDGSWEITLAAPVDMPDGVTKSYSLHAECTEDGAPYLNDYFGIATPATPAQYLRYFIRPLYVTGFGASEVAEGEGPSGAPTTTTSTTSTTTLENPDAIVTTTLPTPTTLVGQAVQAPVQAQAFDPTSGDDVRRELELKERSSSDVSLASAAGAGPATPLTPVDGGIPWWAFALAAMLAVSAVVAYGAKRQSVLSELDRE